MRTKTIAMLFLFVSGCFANVFGQVTVPVNPPNGGFKIDGTLKVNSSVGDWAAGTSGSGGHVFQSYTEGGGVAVSGLNAGWISDPYNNTSDFIFTGSAFSDNPNDWSWTSGKPTSKCDINNGMYLVTSSSTAKWMVLGGDRFTTTGTSYIDFEFYQGVLTRENAGKFKSVAADGTTSLASTGGRTPGDFVLSMEYSNGGVTAVVHYYVWEQVLVNSKLIYKYVEHAVPSTAAYGATNGASVPAAFTNSAFGTSDYIPYAFVEAAVNIDAILSLNCNGLSIKTLFIKTKASDSYTAALKDFLEPQAVNFDFGNVGLSYSPSVFCKAAGTVSPTVGLSGGTFSLEDLAGNPLTPGSATLDMNSSGVINVGNSTVGTYVVRYTLPSGGCSIDDTAHITIKATPGTPSPTNNSTICVGSTLNLFANVTADSYSWTGPASFSSTLQNPSRTNATTAMAGTYSLVITNNGCSSGSGTTSVTIDAAPTTATAGLDQIRCGSLTSLGLGGSTPSVGTGTWTKKSGPGTVSFSANEHTPNATATVSVQGIYVFTWTIHNGVCTDSKDDIQVTFYDALAAPTVCVVQPTLCGSSTGKVKFTDLGAGYQYSILNGAAGSWKDCPVFLNVAAGSVTGLVIKNSDGCVSSPASCTSVCAPEEVIQDCPSSGKTTMVKTEQSLSVQNEPNVKAYPNPFNDRVKFVVNSPQSGNGSLEVYNVMGQRVKTIYQGRINAGNQTFEMTIPKKQQETLIYVLRVDDKKVTGKLLQLNN